MAPDRRRALLPPSLAAAAWTPQFLRQGAGGKRFQTPWSHRREVECSSVIPQEDGLGGNDLSLTEQTELVEPWMLEQNVCQLASPAEHRERILPEIHCSRR